ncbi:molybdopterin-guanine dinucleotide biosynthesis protein MobB [Inquilinus sp. KBS0705]|nr:molybdopterin-guanine dinucleotide biosynthesis protein MobB [Inquilinus sp. KBS0705]
MHVNITKSETGNNKGSSSQLVAYLEKENRIPEGQHNNLRTPEYWFNHTSDSIQPYDVRRCIDGNVAKLSKEDAKFFLVNMSPSSKELLFLKGRFGEEQTKAYLKAYANAVMDVYAKNFKRKGVNGNKDLIYFGKLEYHRYYTFKDLEVRKDLARKGDIKPGEQLHMQVIVSRKDASNSIKLSPLNNSKGANAAHSEKVGQFDRVAFKHAAESLFDTMFGYERGIEESFRYANTLKHGSYEQKQDVKEQMKFEAVLNLNKNAEHGQGLLKTLFNDDGDYNAPVPDGLKRTRKKKRRRNSGGLGL